MIKIGDVVTLKSGGPLMTVRQIDEDFVTVWYWDAVNCTFVRNFLLDKHLLNVVDTSEIITEPEGDA